MSVRGVLYLVLGALPIVTLPITMGAPTIAVAQQAKAGTASASATIRGTVADPDNAVIPGATVTLTPPSGTEIVVISQGDGTYVFPSVRPGVYSETVTMKGFAPFVKLAVRVSAGQSLTLDARMAVEVANQEVNVTAGGATLSTDPDNNASATVIKGKDLEALSDDPDELSSELSALAGPTAGPNGGQIYVDGFTGGQLPPKSSIREIRINQNPFSAQFDKVGYGRVEVFTKPGTDKYHGFFQGIGNANFFNTGNPLLGSVQQLPYHTFLIFGNITGPISSKASFSIGGSHRIIQDNSIFTGSFLGEPGSSTPCSPGTPEAPSACTLEALPVPILFPQVRTDFTPRVDYQLTDKNTLTVRYQYETNSQKNNGIGNLNLPSEGYNLDSTENEIQIVDSQIFSDRVINETRFEYGRDMSSQQPLTIAPTIQVEGAFNGGGSSTQTVNDHQDHFEVQNYTSIALAKHFLHLGGRLRTTRDANYSDSQSLGIFSYSALQASSANPPDQSGIVSAYDTGQAEQYTVAKISQGSVHATLADLGVYAEDDWKLRPNFTISYGFRYETQNHLRDHHDIAPRVSFAYGLGKNKSSPQTVLRGGFGIFYDRFSLTNVITTEQQNGVNQQIYKVTDPSASCTPTDQSTCLTKAAAAKTTYTEAPTLRSPYVMQAAVGVDEQLGKIGTISITYLNMRGVHQPNSYNLGAPVPEADGTIPAPIPGTANQYEFASDAVLRQNQLTISPHINYGRSISIFGYYGLSFAKSDTLGSGYFPSVVGDLGADYGRANYDQHSYLNLGGSFSLPHKILLAPFMVATSGIPFNIITGKDLNGDSILTNDRPAFAGPTTLAANFVHTAHGDFDVNPAVGVARIPINYGVGPAAFTLNLRIVKTFGFGSDTGTKTQAGRQGSQGGPGGPPPGGQRGGGGGGGARGSGGMFGSGGSSGKRYSINVGASINNIFNDVDRGVPSGIVGSPEFYKSTSLAGNVFTSNTAVRRISLLASFSF